MGAPPSFDEGEQKPAPIERTGNDGVRSAPPSSPASSEKVPDDKNKHSEATMPPGEGVDPKRNTMLNPELRANARNESHACLGSLPFFSQCPQHVFRERLQVFGAQ